MTFHVSALAKATLAATTATASLWAVARGTGQDLLVVTRGTDAVPVPLGAVVVSTLLGGVAAAGLGRLSSRWSDLRRCYLVLCALGLAVTSVPPLQSARSTGTAAWLLVLHGVAAAILIPAGLPARTAPVRAA